MNLKAKLILVLMLTLTLFHSDISPLTATDDPLNITWSKLTSERVVGLDWSPNGDYLVSGLYETSEIIILNWRTGEIVQRVAFPGPSATMLTEFSPEWSPDGHTIANANGNVYLLDPETSQLHVLQEPRGEFGYVDVDWSPDSDFVAALSGDGYLDIVSTQTGEIAQTIDVAGGEMMRGEGGVVIYESFDWSPDGNLFAASRYLTDTAPLTLVMGFWDRAGDLIEAYTQEVPSDSFPSPTCSAYGSFLYENSALMWANDSRTLAVGGSDGYGICRLNIDETIDDFQVSGHGVDTVRWSPDQQWLAASHGNLGICSIWLSPVAQDYETHEVRIGTQECFINSLAWSPDSHHLAAGTNDGIWIGTFSQS